MSDAFIRVELYRLAEGEVREVIGHCSGVVEDKLGLSDLTPVGPVVAEIESPVLRVARKPGTVYLELFVTKLDQT